MPRRGNVIGEQWKESKLIKTLQIDISLFSLSCLYYVCLLTGGELNGSVCVKTVMDLRGVACLRISERMKQFVLRT